MKKVRQGVDQNLLTDQWKEIIEDDEIQIVIEVMGGIEPAKTMITEALKAGKAPVTDQTVELDSVETRMGKKTIELHHVSKRFGEKKILDDFSYIVLRNQRLGIIGPNGCVKSSFLKMIAGVL